MKKLFSPLVQIGVIAVVLLAIFLVFTLIMEKDTVEGNEQLRNRVENLAKLPDLSITIDNSENPPVWIQDATAKELKDEEYEHLTLSSPVSSKYISCPRIKVVNNTDRTVKAFTLGLWNNHTNKVYTFRTNSQAIAPFQEFVIEPVKWADARKKGVRRFVEEGGTSKEDTSLPSWSSEEMWFPGAISEFFVLMGEVTFTDGHVWRTTR